MKYNVIEKCLNRHCQNKHVDLFNKIVDLFALFQCYKSPPTLNIGRCYDLSKKKEHEICIGTFLFTTRSQSGKILHCKDFCRNFTHKISQSKDQYDRTLTHQNHSFYTLHSCSRQCPSDIKLFYLQISLYTSKILDTPTFHYLFIITIVHI